MGAEFLTRREYERERKLDRRALKLQAKEYKRRLVVLNGEHKQNVENWRVSVRQDIFDQYKVNTDKKIDDLESERDKRAALNALFRTLASAGALGFLWNIAKSAGWVG